MISQLLYFFVTPIGFGFSACALAGVLGFAGWRKSAVGLAVVTFVFLWIFSTPAFVHQIVHTLEQDYPGKPMAEISQVDVIVVLGGGIDSAFPPRIYPDLEGASDRIWHAARLFKAGKANFILAAGGLPSGINRASEAQNMLEFLSELGVPEEKVLLEQTSRSTVENAKNTKRIWNERGFSRGLLVTSATHMHRALAAFRKQGMDVDPVAIDHQGIFYKRRLRDWLPKASALHLSTKFTHEIIAMLLYRLRGWV